MTVEMLAIFLALIGLSSLVAQSVKSLPAMQETWVQSLGWDDPLEKKIATHSSNLAWRIPWTDPSTGHAVHSALHGDSICLNIGLLYFVSKGAPAENILFCKLK